MKQRKLNLFLLIIVFAAYSMSATWGICGGFEEAPPETQTKENTADLGGEEKTITAKQWGKTVAEKVTEKKPENSPGLVENQVAEMIKNSEANVAALSSLGHDPSKADSKKKQKKTDEISSKLSDTVYVMPEKRKFVTLSKTDINRIHCEGDRKLSGAIFSEDKGIVVNRNGSNGFLRIVPESYAFSAPFELFFICSDDAGSSLYRVIGNPEMELSKNVILKDDGTKMQQGINFFKGKHREQALVEMIQITWNENWEPAWKVVPRYKPIVDNEEYRIIWYRTVKTMSEWTIEQYIVEAKINEVHISEVAFVNRHTAAVSVFEPVIKNGQLGQVVVVREKVENI